MTAQYGGLGPGSVWSGNRAQRVAGAVCGGLLSGRVVGTRGIDDGVLAGGVSPARHEWADPAVEVDAVNSLTDDRRLRELLDRLHAASDRQIAAIDEYDRAGGPRPTGFEPDGAPERTFWLDKYVALDRDKAEFVYALCRAAGATRIVEAGTSFGVSTLYLAAAVRDNGGGLVTSGDIEATKAAVARRHLDEAGLSSSVDVLVGDVRETLPAIEDPVDVLLLDIWAPIAGDVAATVGPRLRTGGIIVADNTLARRQLYAGLFEHLDDPANGFTTQTLPFDGGLELAVKTAAGHPA